MTRAKRRVALTLAVLIMFVFIFGGYYLSRRLSNIAQPLDTWAVGTPVTSLVFSPSKELLAAGLEDGRIQLRSTRDGSLLHTLHSLPSAVTSLAFSPDGTLLAGGTSRGDTPIYLWRIDDMQEYGSMGRNYAVHALAFSPDGHSLAAGGNYSEINLWNVESKQLVATLQGAPSYHRNGSVATQAIAYSKDGKLFAACNQDEGVRIWRLPGEQEVSTGFGIIRDRTSNILSAAAFAPDVTTVATTYYDISGVHLWSPTDTSKKRSVGGERGDIWSIAFSHDGLLLASGGGHSQTDSPFSIFYSQDYDIYIYSPIDGMRKAILAGHTDSVRSLAWSAMDELLASGGDDGTIRLWQVK